MIYPTRYNEAIVLRETDKSRALMTAGSSRHRPDAPFERVPSFSEDLIKERRVYFVK